MNTKLYIPALLFLFLLAACGGSAPAPTQELTLGENILSQPFDNADAWETYVDDDSDLQVTDGVYRIEVNDVGFIWGQNELKTEDVVIEVETNQLSDFNDNGYGIICRADAENKGDGYYFLISGDGYASIHKWDGPDVTALVDWQESSAINQGQASNKIKAVCIGDYLAIYVNDTFVAETTDSSYLSGFTALTAVASEGGNARITFDNLNIWKAMLP